jgi:hypothetical protein
VNSNEILLQVLSISLLKNTKQIVFEGCACASGSLRLTAYDLDTAPSRYVFDQIEVRLIEN